MPKAEDDVRSATERLAAEVARRHGLEAVEVRFHRHGSRGYLRVDIDRPGATGVSLDDCEIVSRDLEVLLDEADVVPGPYDLQVSSPGLDRPIRTDDDIRRNTGRFVLVETSQPVAGRRRFRGILRGLEGGALRVELADGEMVLVDRALVLIARQEVRLGGWPRGGD